MEHTKQETKNNWLKSNPLRDIQFSWELIVFLLIILAAATTRFYDLGARVISHDETSHVYYAWRLFKGMGYSHDPITHGPFQFHFLAFVYFLFGDSDYTARIPAAISSVLTIIFLWKYRRYLGSWGTIAAALMTLISPFMLYYGRYVRNEAFVALFGVVSIWAVLRYLETKKPRFLYWLTAATVLHFTTKETAFIYTAQMMVFLGLVYISDMTQKPWKQPGFRNLFISGLIAAVIFAGVGIIAQGSIPETPESVEVQTGMHLQVLIPLALAVIMMTASLLFSIIGFTWKKLKELPSFSALLLLGTLVLPQLAPFPVEWFGFDPLNYTNTGMFTTGVFIAVLSIIAVAIGLTWNPREWLINAGIFYIPFTIFYTTFFTNGSGFFTGLVGSLGYWLDQQAVERGSQPWYYYWLIQLPVYEYLPLLGGIGTAIGVLISKLQSWSPLRDSTPIEEVEQESDHPELLERKSNSNRAPVFALLAFWSLTSLIAYPIAGEKMPWLTVHIAFPLILLSAWGIQKVMEGLDPKAWSKKQGWAVMLLMIIALVSTFSAVGDLLSANPPFQGQELNQLRSTGDFLSSVFVLAMSAAGLWFLLSSWEKKQIWISSALTLLLLLVILTTHTAFQAAFINYDKPTEYLVYAHGGRGVKEALAQIEEISYRTTDGLALEVAFDNETTYPYWWYLRNYDNQRYYAENPTRDLVSAPVILVGNNNYPKIEPVVGNAYYQFTYNRIVWPNQDYFGLNREKIWNAVSNPQMREAIFDIWLNRDYTKYAQATGRPISLASWSPADQMRLYVRKDIAAKVWNYGPEEMDFSELTADPYEGKEVNLPVEASFDNLNLSFPRNLAAAADGTIYILDTGNHRVIQIDSEGEIVGNWGGFSGNNTPDQSGGLFNEPWGIDVGPDGSVYVADTWNHRIQKFSSDGEFITQWGQFGQRETPFSLWGPRDVAVDSLGHVYVSDTGNKRILVYDPNGQFLTEFGDVGLGDGQFDEPSGLVIDGNGNLYVADTWNQRIQAFAPDQNGIASIFLTKWDVAAWYGQSLDNKPYLAVDQDGNILVSDPEVSRILQFSPEGELLAYWEADLDGNPILNLPTGLSVDPQGAVWIIDTQNNRIIKINFPVQQ